MTLYKMLLWITLLALTVLVLATGCVMNFGSGSSAVELKGAHVEAEAEMN